MPRCKACGTEAPAMARFCSICGAQVAPAAPPPPRPAAAAPPPTPAATRPPVPVAAPTTGPAKMPNQVAWSALGAGAVLLLGAAGFLFAKASGLLGAPAPTSQTTGVLSAPGTHPAEAPILAPPQTQTPQTPVLQPPTTAGAPMPEDVVAYLRWLKAYHQNLGKLTADLEGVGMSVIPDIYTNLMGQISADDPSESTPTPKPEGGVLQKLNGITQQLNLKTAEFQQKTPPNPCAALAMGYGQALATEVRQCSSLVQTFTKIAQSFSGDINEGHSERQNMLPDLMKELQSGSMSRTADDQVRAANDALDALRDRYTDIPSDINRSNFQLQPLDSGMDPKRFLSGKLPGM